MLFEEENESWFEECKDFVEEDGRVLMVRIYMKPGEVKFSDVDHLLRVNRYRGKIIYNDSCDTHILLINMHKMTMISVLNHFDYFEKICIGNQIISFELFLQLHIRLKGRMLNRISIGGRTVTFTIPNN